jgi:ABC-type transport system involved in multi-copper enzyme maturation permease subunit
MRWWQDLISDNPMMIETKLFFRKFFGAHAIANTLAIVAIATLLSLLIGLLYVYEIPYVGPAIAALAVLTLVIPILLHGAIAGERERRSWEMLLVAPITNAQIVIGKFAGSAQAILVIVGAFAVAIVIADFPRGDRLASAPVVIGVVLTFALLVAGFTMLISSFSKRSITAISVVYGCMFFALVVLPALITASSPRSDEFALYLNPFFAVGQINQERMPDVTYITYDPAVVAETSFAVNSYLVYGVMHIVIYSTLAALCLYVSIRSLNASGLDDPTPQRKR